MPPVTESFERLLVALLVGLLIGVDRERAEARKARPLFAGIRTFQLIALAGAVPALLMPIAGTTPLVISLVAVAAFSVAAYVQALSLGYVGATTELAALVTFFLGALAGVGELLLAGGVGIAVATLLVIKPRLEAFSRALSEDEISSALELAIISGIILPLLPNRGFGPWDFFNPFDIWTIVVLVSGVSFAGFVAMRVFGRERGIVVSGVMGATVSSTAVTVAMASRSREEPALASLTAGSTVLASVVMCLRVGIFVAALAPGLLPRLAPVIAGMTVVGLAVSWFLLRGATAKQDAPQVETMPGNPFSLWAALSFGALYASVVFLVRAGQEMFGGAGVYVVAALSSIVDVDAVTIAITRRGPDAGGWREAAAAVSMALVINTMVKTGIAATGGAEFRRYAAGALASMMAAGALAGGVVWWAWR